MQVFKFGGASVKDAKAIKNLENILNRFKKEKILIVISAIGKTTNALEFILHQKLKGLPYEPHLEGLKEQHYQLCDSLQLTENQKASIELLFSQLTKALEYLQNDRYDFNYDQLISFGEKLSTTIIFHFLSNKALSVTLENAPDYVKTDETYRDALVNWNLTNEAISNYLKPKFKDFDFIITQGFIGGTSSGYISTLGREGSDFSAAIFAQVLKVKSVTIWKDVLGIFNADPKKIPDAILIDELSYQEAAEMTYYGASVIHPKTIKPLANHQIPLQVRSFQNVKHKGTLIHQFDQQQILPAIIIKENQSLLTFQITDFTFTHEAMLGKIFNTLNKHHIKINMMQNSAISFSICVNDDLHRLDTFREELKSEFSIRYNQHLTLYTIKNYTEELIQKYKKGKSILMEQKTRKNYQMVVHS